MIWNVELLKGINGIEYGTSRDEVRKLIGLPYKEGHSVLDFGVYHDYFGDSCCVEYDCSFKMIAIEIYRREIIYISGKKVFPGDISEYSEFVDDFVEDEDGYISRRKSVGLYLSNGKIESVTFGQKNYYDFIFTSDEKFSIFNESFLSEVSEKLDEEMKKDFRKL